MECAPHRIWKKLMALVLSLVLMVWGYRAAAFLPVYTPLPGMGHLNNTLMLIAVFLFGVGGTKGGLYPRIRHPMLIGVVVWAVAHLLVNGDTPSFVLFGGIAVWALVSMALINRAGPWVVPAAKPAKFEGMAAGGSLIVYGVIVGIHYALGYPTFG